jgi:hypothetical protein
MEESHAVGPSKYKLQWKIKFLFNRLSQFYSIGNADLIWCSVTFAESKSSGISREA